MRLSLGLLVAGSVALVACSGDDGVGSIRRGAPPGGGAPVDPNAGAAVAAAPASVACPATVAAPTALSTVDTNATDVRIVGGVVFYRDGARVLAIDPVSGARHELYTSPDLVHSFVDDAVVATVESPNPPDAVLRIRPATGATPADPTKLGADLTVTPDGWSAGGTTVFGSDATSLYVLADVTNQGDTIYKVSKADPSVMTALTQLDAASLGDPQLAGTDVWFVRDQKRVYQIIQTVDATDPLNVTSTPGPATEIFGLGYADCKLAVGGSHAFCSTGTALEQRSLTGGDLQTVFDAQKVAAPTRLGAPLFETGTVFVRSVPSSPSDALKNGIHAVKGTDDRLVACGRETINALAADSTSVVWAEQGKGVFRASR
jgi:hypothetical protein